MDFSQVAENLKQSFSDEEQRIFVKFGVLQNHSVGVIAQDLKRMLGPHALPESTVRRWVAMIRSGRTDMRKESGGDHQDVDVRQQRVEAIKACFAKSRHWSLRSLASNVQAPYSTVRRIVEDDLGMIKKLGKWVPHLLTPEQKENRVLCSEMNLREYHKTNSLLKRTLSIDESWVGLYNEPDRNQVRQWCQRGENPDVAVHEELRGEKRMLTMALDFNGIAFWELLPPKTTCNGERYRDFLARNFDLWPGKPKRGKAVLLHDGARPHIASVVKEFLAEKNIDLWKHPPYSPDISPLDYGCFGKLKRRLRGVRHRNWEEFEKNFRKVVYDLSNENAMTAIQDLPKRWQRVIETEGEYL